MSNEQPEVAASASEDDGRVSRAEAARDALRMVRRRGDGVLCTISRKVAGWPFGSAAPYALDARGEPLLLISALAEHTRNIKADDRVSLFVQEQPAGGDVQAHGRVTLMGRAHRVHEAEAEDGWARYLARVPSAATYGGAHDFSLYGISLEQVRYIGGFGRIFWLDAEQLRLDPAADPLAAGATGILAHMNHDHADTLVLYCRAFRGLEVERATMVGIDQFGFDVQHPGGRIRFDFEEPATPATIRGVLVDLAKRARAKLAP